MSRQEATAAAIGGVVAPSSFEAALLVSAWAEETGRQLQDWQFDAYQALVQGKSAEACVGRMHGKAQAQRDAEDLARWLNQQQGR